MYTDDKMNLKESFLRHILRRHPDHFNLTISPDGWVNAQSLLHNVQSFGYALTMNDIQEIMKETVTEYSFNNDCSLIRANYGHSLQLKLEDIVGLPSTPDGNLYHGTTDLLARKILKFGLLPQTRDHVFLTSDPVKADEYGKRHGNSVTLEIDSKLCIKNKCMLFHPCSHIWLAYYIPPECIHYFST